MSISGKTKRWLAAGAAVLAIGGGSGLALAQQGGSTSASPPATSTQTAPDTPEPGDTPDRAGASQRDDGLAPGASSVQAPNGADADDRSEGPETPGREDESERESPASEAAEDAAEKAESAKLASLAKIDQAQAEQAALAKVPGTVTEAELGNENGNVVWEIDVKGQDGAQHDVKVDAGSGTVLAAAVDDQD